MSDLKQRLQAAGLNEEAIADTLGPVPNLDATEAHLRLCRADDSRSALIRLFLLGETVPATALPVDAGELVAAGLALRDRGSVHSQLRLTPYKRLLIAHDGDERLREESYVSGVNNATRTLATLTVRQPVARALDLGTGSGVQALLASRHASTVVATDVDARALEYAALNGRLNDVSLDLRDGSWFEPVEGERFGLIVSNPPFVISPDRTYTFRDSGLAGDAVSREVVRGAAEHLEEGGHATVLCNWICRNRRETWQPLEEWVDGTGCDALLLAHNPVDPFTYAARWNEPLRGDREAFVAAVERWLDEYERSGVVAIGIGAVVLRRREGDNWRRGLELARPATGSASGQLLRLFAAADAPAAADATLLGERFRLVDGHHLEQRLRFDSGTYALARVEMTLDEGIGLAPSVDAAALPALFALDPSRPLSEAVAESEVAPADVLPTLRRLYELGFLERA